MTNYQRLQEGLIDWFNRAPLEYQSIQSAVKVCQEIYYPEDIQLAKYKILYPLIRWGLIEFYGDDKLRLSPSAIIYNQEYVMAYNVPPAITDIVKKQFILAPVKGIVIYKASPDILKSFTNLGIPSSKFDLKQSLTIVPNFSNIIYSWEEYTMPELSTCQHFSLKSQWIKPDIYPNIGVYKKGNKTYGTKMVRINQLHWKYIPNQKRNLDAFAIAVLWCQVNNNQNIHIKYQPSTHILSIDNYYFPLSIERLLHINSLISGAFPKDLNERKYSISKDLFNILNKLLDNKITIYE